MNRNQQPLPTRSNRIPTPIRPLLSEYRAALMALPVRVYGVYLYGSVALDGFDARSSDIDAVALTDDPAALGLTVTWAGVLDTMRSNLATYWAGQRAALTAAQERHPQFALPDAALPYIVGTLCRILTTVEEGTITTKAQAVRAWQPRLPAPFQPLLAETIRLQQHATTPSAYPAPAARTEDTLRFLDYVLDRGTQALAR
jgi:hypothetical protein